MTASYFFMPYHTSSLHFGYKYSGNEECFKTHLVCTCLFTHKKLHPLIFIITNPFNSIYQKEGRRRLERFLYVTWQGLPLFTTLKMRKKYKSKGRSKLKKLFSKQNILVKHQGYRYFQSFVAYTKNIHTL